MSPTNPYLRLAVLLGILLCGIVAVLIDPNWIHSPIGFVDGWAYVGHFLDPVLMRRALPRMATGDLLPLILPASLLFHLFGAAAGNLLFKLFCYTISGYLFFRIVEIEFNLSTALITTSLLIFCYLFFVGMGGDYTDGRVILYYLATLYAVSRAHAGISAGTEAWWLVGAGFFYALCLSTAILSLAYSPVLVLFVLLKRFHRQASPDMGRLRLLALGALGSVLALCLLHWSFAGHFLFFRDAIAQAVHIATHARRYLTGNDAVPSWCSLGAGIVYAFCIAIAGLSLATIPVLAIYSRCKRPGQPTARLIGPLLLPALGCAGGMLALCLVHWSYTGHFLYFTNTLDKAFQFMHRNRAFHNGNPLPPAYYHLGLFILATTVFQLVISLRNWAADFAWLRERCLVSISTLLSRPVTSFIHFGGKVAHAGTAAIIDSQTPPSMRLGTAALPVDVTFPLLLLAHLLIIEFLQDLKQQETLTNLFYLNQITPVLFLALASIIFPYTRQLSRFALALIIPVLVYAQGLCFQQATAMRPTIPAILTPAIILTLMLSLLTNDHRVRLAIILVFFLYTNLLLFSTDYLTDRQPVPAGGLTRAGVLAATERWMAFIDTIDVARHGYLWYNTGEAYGGLYASLSAASHQWQGHVYNEAYPQLDVPIGEVGVVPSALLIEEQRPLIILTADTRRYQEAADNFRRQHIALLLRHQQRFCSGNVRFTVYECVLRRNIGEHR